MVCSVGTGTVAEYYLNEQAEYYTGGKEPKGRWYTLAVTFGLKDGASVNAETFRNLHEGLSPDGVPLAQNNQALKTTRVGGYDLTFSAPKSVSVLWAAADESVRIFIELAQEKASRQALEVLSKHASYTRRGKGGRTIEKVKMFGATFQHGESRPTERADGSVASDPQLHTHSVIFNMAARADGTWGSLDGRHFYKWKMAAGAIYRTHLAHELRTNLGVSIDVKNDGLFEIAGIPKDIRDHFSARRIAIKQDLTARGLKTKDAQALASAVTKASRRTKSTVDDTAQSRHVRWKLEAEEQGLSDKIIEACMNKQVDDLPPEKFTEKFREIPRQLTEHDAVFRLETLYRAAAVTALETGVEVNEINREISKLLKNSEVVEIWSDELGIPMYSTQEMIQVEGDLVAIAQRGTLSKRHWLPERVVNPRLQSSNLTNEQRIAVEFVAMGADIAVMEGSAGAGKTHALRSVADAYRDGGYRVIGTSTAWRMANQLGDDLNVESRAIDSWLAQDKVGKPFLDGKTVLIVDEAGQLSSRQMLKVLQAAEQAEAKVILTGDQRQLQAIGAGPGLRLVSEQTGVARIDTIIRQREAWAREAVESLSVGRADKAIVAFEEKSTLKWCADGKEAVGKAVSDWKAYKALNPGKTALVMAKTNKQVRALNMEMRDHLRDASLLHGKDHILNVADTSGRGHKIPMAIGEQVMFKKRIDELGVINGTTGVVTQIETEPTGIKMSVNVQGREIEFKAEDVADDQGRALLAHGYSSTIYSAQGVTVDAAYVVADHNLKRNEIYVAASRARDNCNIYVDCKSLGKAVKSQMPLTDRTNVNVPKEKLREHLSKSWSRAQTKTSTRDFASSLNIQRTKVKMALPRIEAGR